MTRPALILAGHGSHISAETAGLVWRCVDRLRAWDVADEITACFWKESPSFSRVLDTVQAREIVVVPVFMAAGYFTRSVIPVEMGLTGSITQRAGRTITYTRTLGDHAGLESLVRQRVEDALAVTGFSPDETAVAIIGHGTPRSQRSQDAARHQADRLRESGWGAEVFAVYLDDEPDIPSLYEMARAPNVIAVPFFLASGSHVTRDVPRALGLAPGQDRATIRGKRVIYTPPAGTDKSICALVLDLAREIGLTTEGTESTEKNKVKTREKQENYRDMWRGFPRVGVDDLWEAVNDQFVLTFGQLRLTPDVAYPVASPDDAPILATPADLRRAVRETPFRPLPTRRDLPGGWQVAITSAHQLGAVVETVYPGALAQWSALQRGTLAPTSLPQVSARQQGRFRNLDRLPVAQMESVLAEVCGMCALHPAWIGTLVPAIPDSLIPCAEPCNVWLSRAKRALTSHPKDTVS